MIRNLLGSSPINSGKSYCLFFPIFGRHSNFGHLILVKKKMFFVKIYFLSWVKQDLLLEEEDLLPQQEDLLLKNIWEFLFCSDPIRAPLLIRGRNGSQRDVAYVLPIHGQNVPELAGGRHVGGIENCDFSIGS